MTTKVKELKVKEPITKRSVSPSPKRIMSPLPRRPKNT